MAFVFETKRKINELSKTMNPLGPGQYFKEEMYNNQKDCAPFHSTNRRRSFFDPANQNKLRPGPGNYQISKPFIEPNIKTVSNSQSIIVKINSTGTSQFKSVVQRFGIRDLEVPGPGQYVEDKHGSESPKRKSLSHRSIHENQIINQIKKMQDHKNYPAIPEKTRGLTDAKKQEVNPEGKLGPAFYNPAKKHSLNSTGTVWGKDKVKRFSVDQKGQVGPGKYNAEFNPIKPQDKISQPSSHFKSNTVRTYFDSMLYKTNLNEIALQRGSSKYKAKQPAPGQYQTNVSSIKIQEKPYAFQFFGSTVQRFTDNTSEVPTDKKSKSFYNIKSDIGRNHSFNKSEHAFMSDTTRRPEFLKVNEKQKNPGPGQYRDSVKIEKKLRGNKPQKFGATQKRMFQQQDELDIVGPGKYENNHSAEKAQKNARFGQVNDISCNFKSITARDCFGTNQVDKNPFAEYDVSHNDVSKRMEKQKNFLENLKKIDVERAGFESSKSRFPHYDTPKQNNLKNPTEDQKQQELKLKQEAEKVRELILEVNKTQVQEVKKNHFGKSQRFQHDKKKAPPVGQYSVKNNWEKRSYNVKYSK